MCFQPNRRGARKIARPLAGRTDGEANCTNPGYLFLGSTIGSDAGINLLHALRPAFLQIMKGHTPTFVSRIEARITDDQTRRDAVSPTR